MDDSDDAGTASRPPIEVAVVDDHSMYRDGAALWLETETAGAVRVVTTAPTVEELLKRGPLPPVVVLDLRLADESDPCDNIRRLTTQGSAVIVHSATETPSAVRAMVRAGASGYVPKSAPLLDIVEAVCAAARGEPYFSQNLAYAYLQAPDGERPDLSRREIEVLRGVAAGRTRSAVARSLGISEGTVKTYLERIRQKYDAVSRPARSPVDLYRRAAEDGFLEDRR
ncbi:MAG: LuxR C-terminal-related transcriptional regulator [Pseudonocardiaceae bacterium]